MRSKKLLSTVVASALVASTMAMPVMAADGAEVDVDVNTRTAVIRVKVPTSLQVEVNQFEKGDTGSQIYSGTFDIINKSEIPVKMTVTSTATLATTDPISLVSTKAAVEKSESDEAWLAVAAQTSAGNYIEGSGKTIKDLTDASENVTTFAQGKDADASKGTATQIFYLDANATPNVTYTMLAPTNADEAKTAQETSYAQIYEISDYSSNFTDSTEVSTSQPELDTIIAAGDVYVDNGTSVTLIPKGTEGTTYATTNTYYTVVKAVSRTEIAENKTYVYGESADGGKTGFRYIGKLSESKETWTESDISRIKIKYDIAGVTGTRYAEVSDPAANLLLNGLYKGTAEAGVVITPAALNANTKAVVITGLADGATLSKVELVKKDGTKVAMASGTQYNYAPATGTFTILKDVLVGATYVGGKYVLTFGDTTVEVPIAAVG